MIRYDTIARNQRKEITGGFICFQIMLFIVPLRRSLLTDQHLIHSRAEGVRLALLLFVSIRLMAKKIFILDTTSEV